MVLSLPSSQVTRTNEMSPFYNLFGNYFSVFSQKSQNIMASIVIFFEGLYYNYNIKKSNHIQNLHGFK